MKPARLTLCNRARRFVARHPLAAAAIVVFVLFALTMLATGLLEIRFERIR